MAGRLFEGQTFSSRQYKVNDILYNTIIHTFQVQSLDMDASLQAVYDLPASQQRRVAAIVGACIADAAARPCHWQYDVDKLKEQLGESQ